MPGLMTFPVPGHRAGCRLDVFLAREEELLSSSRSTLQHLIRDGHVLVDGRAEKTGYRLRPGDVVTVVLPPPQPTDLLPEAILFPVLFEDDYLLILSKPPGLVVHPSAGHAAGTLVHGLLHHCDELGGLGDLERPGIVHRLDRDTSGIMVVAKEDRTQRALVELFKNRQITKTYLAILDGIPAAREGTVDYPLGRHPVNRKKMAVRPQDGRHALTTWRVLESFRNRYALVELGLFTGRTHQIRVHMAALGHPVAGDPVYGKKNREDDALQIKRQCLHSFALAFRHPVTGENLCHEAPLWSDMEHTLGLLREQGR